MKVVVRLNQQLSVRQCFSSAKSPCRDLLWQSTASESEKYLGYSLGVEADIGAARHGGVWLGAVALPATRSSLTKDALAAALSTGRFNCAEVFDSIVPSDHFTVHCFRRFKLTLRGSSATPVITPIPRVLFFFFSSTLLPFPRFCFGFGVGAIVVLFLSNMILLAEPKPCFSSTQVARWPRQDRR